MSEQELVILRALYQQNVEEYLKQINFFLIGDLTAVCEATTDPFRFQLRYSSAYLFT